MNVKCEDTILSSDINNIEKNLSIKLQEKRLICEMSFSCEDVDVWRQKLMLQGELAWTYYPHLAAVTTVGIGMYHYEHGDFWSAFSGLNNPTDQQQWGQQFKRFLKKHETLETFQNLHGLAYVAPILAHGGVPQYCLPDFFDLLTHYGNPEQPSLDFIDYIGDNPICMTNIDKPVQRFLLHGGEVAEEFVARSLALWQSHERGDGGGTQGLPNRVIETFSVWFAEHRTAHSPHIRRLPKPEIMISPGNLWIYLRLPRCDNHPEIDPNACWKVLGKTLAVSRNHEVPILPVERWTIKLKTQEFVLQGISDSEPVLFFDPLSGKLIPNPRLRRLPEHLWAVFNQSSAVEPEPTHKEEIPTWPGYIVAVFNLKGQKYLRVGERQFEIRRPFFRNEQDPIVINVINENDVPVFHAPPKIDWNGDANLSLTRHSHHEENIDIKSEDFQRWFDGPGHYDFILRGPFGQNVHKRFVLIPGLQINMQPEVMWPNTPKLKCGIFADQVDIHSPDGRSPPFISYDSYINFQADFGETTMNLIAKVSRLQWRIIMSSEEVSEWNTKSISLSTQDLERADYPRLVCEVGQLAKEINVSLIGRHGSIHSPQGQRSTISQQNTWAFDLRMILDQVRQSGMAEKFNISVQDSNGVQLYCGAVMTIRPKWDLQDFRAAHKIVKGNNIINIAWRECGNIVKGRWLVIIPLWRPWEWENVSVYQLNDEERSCYEWRHSCIYPGRYVIRAVHAPWGCENWFKAKFIEQKVIDVSKSCWVQIFDKKQDTSNTVESYTESLMAHWYRPQLVRNPPPSPLALTSKQIVRFLDYLNKINKMVELRIPRDGSGALNIFCLNPSATTNAVASVQDFPLIWQKVLPSREIICLEPTYEDKAFIHEVAFQYDLLNTAANSIKQQYKKKYLSPPLKEWHQLLYKNKPPVDDVIFLCEKFDLFTANSLAMKQVYKALKKEYQCKEAI